MRRCWICRIGNPPLEKGGPATSGSGSLLAAGAHTYHRTYVPVANAPPPRLPSLPLPARHCKSSFQQVLPGVIYRACVHP
jgi:hypothetical protein